MLSRRGTRSTKHLRKARSSDSNSLRHEQLRGSTGSEAGGTRHHALTAAELAFEREYGFRGRDRPTARPRGSENAQPALHRTQSVRFAGPKAVPPRQTSITRRHATTWDNVESRSTTSCLSRRQSLRSTDTSLTALPQPNSIVNTPISKSGGIRKAKSLFNAREALSGDRFSEIGPVHTISRPRSFDPSETHAGSPEAIASSKHDIMLASALLEERFGGHTNHGDGGVHEDGLARRLKKQSSAMVMGRRKQSPKPFRKTVRSSSTTRFGAAVSSPPVNHPPPPRVSTVGLRVRHISSSVKGKVIRAFRRTSGSDKPLPQQQVDARKSHFGDRNQDSPKDACYPFVPMPDEELVSRCSSRASSARGYPTPFNPTLQPGSIRTMQSATTDGSKSRVTSWANSTVADGTQKINPAELKRLSVIQENGDMHQPSSSAGLVGQGSRGRRVHELFRRPLRPGTGRVHEPVDSGIIYSVLQRRLEEIKFEEEERRRLGGSGSESSRRTSTENSTHPVRNVSANSEDTCHTTVRLVEASPAPDAMSAVLSEYARPGDSNDVFETPTSLHRSSSQKASTGQAREEYHPPSRVSEEDIAIDTWKKPTVERGSMFFPAYQDVHQKDLSPYRKAMLAKIAEEDSRATVYDPALIAPNMLSSRLEAIAERNGSGNSVSESNYSRGVGSPVARGTVGRPFSYVQGDDMDAIGADLRALHQARVEPGSGSSSSVGYADHRSWARASACIDTSEWSKNGWVQRTPAESKHIREYAQLHEDETENLAGDHVPTLEQQGRLFKTPSGSPLHRDTGSLRIDKRSSRVPLLERDASHVHNIQAGGQLHTDVQGNAAASAENQRLPSTQVGLPHEPQTLSNKASMVSLASQVRMALAPTESNGGSSRTSPARPTSMLSRHSPERVARLRRLQSSNALRPKTVPEANAPTAHVQEFFAQAKLAGTRAGSPFVRGGTEGGCTPGGSKMVEEFLSNRRDARHVSEQSTGPAFL